MSQKKQNIGWIGVGRLGRALAERLLDHCNELLAYNRTRSKIESWRKDQVTPADSVAELATCNVVFVCVSASEDLLEVLVGPGGLFSNGKSGGIVVDCSTVSPDASERARKAASEAGWEFLAAPVSGNPRVVASGEASMIISGPQEVYGEVKPLLHMLAKTVVYAGASEQARVVKIAHNLLLGLTIQALSECVSLVEKAGVERQAFLEFLAGTVFASRIIELKGELIKSRTYEPVTFTNTLLRKDFDLGLAEAGKLGVPVPLVATLRQLIQAAIGVGLGESDIAALYELQALLSGLPNDVKATSS